MGTKPQRPAGVQPDNGLKIPRSGDASCGFESRPRQSKQLVSGTDGSAALEPPPPTRPQSQAIRQPVLRVPAAPSALEAQFDRLWLLLRPAGLPLPVAEYRFAPPRRWRFDRAWPGPAQFMDCQSGETFMANLGKAGGVAVELEGGPLWPRRSPYPRRRLHGGCREVQRRAARRLDGAALHRHPSAPAPELRRRDRGGGAAAARGGMRPSRARSILRGWRRVHGTASRRVRRDRRRSARRSRITRSHSSRPTR